MFNYSDEGLGVPYVPRDLYVRRQSALIDELGYPKRPKIDSNAPISETPGEPLARAYGYLSFGKFVADIPQDAQVIDIGAGASTLGLEVCRARPDVSWTNADVCYGFRPLRDRLAEDAPPNLSFLPANMHDVAERAGERRYDRVFSYYALAYVAMIDHQSAVVGAENLLQLPNEDGILSMGPIYRRTELVKSNTGDGDTFKVTPCEKQQPVQELAEQMVQASRLSFWSAFWQKRINQHMRSTSH
jgi:hypothetical protein